MQKLTFILIFILQASYCEAQDINFSQFYDLPLLRNPAFAGLYKGNFRVNGGYRSQWGSVTVPYQTQALSGEFAFAVNQKDFLSLGAQVTNDIAGDSKMGKTQFLPVLAFNKCINEATNSFLSIGFSGGLVQERFDPSKLRFDDQFVNGAYSNANPTQQTFNNTNLLYWDANVGVTYTGRLNENTDFYIGAAYFHFTEPKVAFSQTNDIVLNKKYVFNAGFTIKMNEDDRVMLYGDYFQQGGNHQGQGGFLIKHNLTPSNEDEDEETLSIAGGCFYRWNDATIPVIKLNLPKLSFGLSYDMNISKLKPASQLRGAFELTICHKNFLEGLRGSSMSIPCPHL